MNKWIGIGRLTRDPEVKRSEEKGTCVARYTLAIDRKIKQEGQQNADYISCVAFGKAGEFVEKYLKQGTKIAVTGRIQTGSYKNKEGKTVYTTDVIVEEHEFVEAKKENTQPEPKESPDDFVDIPAGIEEDLPFK